MKNLFLSCILVFLSTQQGQTQIRNNAAYIKVSSGSYLVALDGVINTNGGTFTVEGTLRTPGDLTNTTDATLQGDGQYFIGGNWTNEAVFNAGTSAVTFTGDQGSTVTSGGDAFYDLALDKTTGNLTLADEMNVANTLGFQAADNYIVLDNNNLQVLHITGYDASRHVRSTGTGFLVRTVGGSPVVFPVGNTSYNPATLSNAGASDLYFVRVADAVLSDGDAGAPLTADAVGRTWFIEEGTPGGSDLTLGVQWNGSEELTGFDHTASYVSHYTGGSWDAQPVVAAAGADPYTLTRTGIATLSPFAVFGGGFVPVIDISGIILWEHDGVSGVQNANVALTGDAVDNTVTPSDGTFTLTANNGSNFTVTPSKNINKLNGVTVADALAIQQHVAGNVPIASPYKQVAADVNKSNSITGFDATIINQSLLGNPSALNQFKTSWRFVPISYAMSVPPWGFPEKISLAGVSGNTPDQDFWGIKTGDVVDVYADPANLVPPPPLVLRASDRVLQAGEGIAVDFRAGQFEDLAAWQFALRFDPDRLQLAGIKPLGGLPLTADDFGVFDIAEGGIRSIWSRATGVAVQEAAPVFQLHFKVLQNGGMLSDALYLDGTALRSIAYNSNMQESEVQLAFSDATSGTGQVADATILLRNRPNPFVDETTIEFNLPEACEAQLRIYDTAGRELWQLKKWYPAGMQQETVRLEGLSGALVCELITPQGAKRLQMIKID